MSKKGKLVEELKQIREKWINDPERMHIEADKALLKFVDDPEVTEIYNTLVSWYS